MVFYQRPLDFLDTYLKNINNVTQKTTKKALKKQINPKVLLVVTVGESGNGKAK